MSDIDKMSFLDKLNYLMDKNKVSRQTLANGTNIPRSTIDNWFNREQDDLKRSHLVALSKFFNVSLDYLCYDNCINETASNCINPFENIIQTGETFAFHLSEGVDVKDLTKEQVEEIISIINYIRSRDKNKKED